jgi:hypothetical protein
VLTGVWNDMDRGVHHQWLVFRALFLCLFPSVFSGAVYTFMISYLPK